MTRATWRGVVTDATTADALTEAARLAGPVYLDPIQGSYTSATANSSGTHDAGGVVDLNAEALTDAQARDLEAVCRRVGFAAWFRPALPGVWQRHIHAVRLDCADLSGPARTQVADYLAGYNGLPIGGRTNRDTGTRAYVDVTWTKYQEDEMPYTDWPAADRKALAVDVAREVHARTVNAGSTVETLAEAVGRTRAGVRALGKIDPVTRADLEALVAQVAAGGATAAEVVDELAARLATPPA